MMSDAWPGCWRRRVRACMEGLPISCRRPRTRFSAPAHCHAPRAPSSFLAVRKIFSHGPWLSPHTNGLGRVEWSWMVPNPSASLVAARPRMALALLLVLTFGAIAPPTRATFRSQDTAGNEQAVAEAITSRNAVGAAQSAAAGSAAAGPDEAAGADGDTGGDEADAHLRRRLLSLHGVLLPHLQRGDARARRVMELLASVGCVSVFACQEADASGKQVRWWW